MIRMTPSQTLPQFAKESTCIIPRTGFESSTIFQISISIECFQFIPQKYKWEKKRFLLLLLNRIKKQKQKIWFLIKKNSCIMFSSFQKKEIQKKPKIIFQLELILDCFIQRSSHIFGVTCKFLSFTIIFWSRGLKNKSKNKQDTIHYTVY